MTASPRFASLRIVVLLGILFSALRFAGCEYLELMDIRAMDYRILQRGKGEHTDAVAIAVVDDRSLEEFGRWPWPRDRIALLIDKLTAAGAAVIGFDMVQSEPSLAFSVSALPQRIEGIDDRTWESVREALGRERSGDEELTAAIGRSERSVLGYFFDFQAGDGAAPNPRFSSYKLVQRSPSGDGDRSLPAPATVTSNLPSMSAAAREIGYFNILQDRDGSCRRIPLGMKYRGKIALPLSLAMLRVYRPKMPLSLQLAENGVESVRVGSTVVPVSDNGLMLLNFRGPGGTFPHLPVADLLRDEIPPEAVRGKMILVGITAPGVGDVKVTPVDGVYPGVELHATALDNILRHDFLWQPKWAKLVEIGIIFVSILVLTLALRSSRGLRAALIAVGLLLGYIVATQWLFVSFGLVLSVVYPLLALAVSYVTISVQHYILEEREKLKVRNALELYLSPSLARLLGKHPEMLELGGAKLELTVLFSDIRGFTTISEDLDPEVLVELLNVYLGEMTEVIFSHEGMLDKYIGDAIVAVWGAPLPQPDHAARACQAAIDMFVRLRELEESWVDRGWPRLQMGIGLNSGPMVFGNMGSAQHMSLTVMGDNANLGSRLEGLTKLYDVRMIVSEATIVAADEFVAAREIDLVRVKGKSRPVRIFEILGQASERDQWKPLLSQFQQALFAYRQRSWKEAANLFETVLEIHPGDGPSKIYIERCRSMLQSPPPEDWDGVESIDVK